MRIFLPALLATTGCLGLASCHGDDSTGGPVNEQADQAAKPQDDAAKLLEMARPNPAAMEADVAKILNASWDRLGKTIADPSLAPAVRAEAYANYGLTAFGNGLTLPAETAFENATRLAPSEARWIYFLALLHEYNGSLEKAAKSFERVLALRPGNLPALLRYGDVRFEQAQMEQAQSLYQRALAVDNQSAAAYYGLGRTASAMDNYAQAVTHFEKALELQPDADRINYFLGLAWRNLGDRGKAESLLASRGVNEPHFVDPLFDEISGGEARIDGLWAHMNAGSQALVDGNYTLAVEELQLATKDLPDDPRAWQSLGMALNKTSDVEGAKSAYRKALDLSRDNASIYRELAKLEMTTGFIEQAEQNLLRAIAIDPGMLEAHSILAGLLAQSGRNKEALQRYQKALALDPQSAELAISRAETLLALGRGGDAASALEEAVKTNPRDANVRMTYGLVLADSNQLEKAIKEVTRALDDAEDDNTRSRAHYAIGQVKLRQSDAQAAIASFAEALKLNPRHNAAGLELARSFLRVQDYEKALGTYKVHIKYWPDSDVSRVEAARVSLMLGDGSGARRLMEDGAGKKSVSARLLGSLARLLVLSTEDGVRDPALALQFAEQALGKNRAPQHSETLALCHAALGQFGKAVELQQKILNEAGSSAPPRVRTRMEKNLQRYQAKSLGRLPLDAS